jgi:hypothetical protein
LQTGFPANNPVKDLPELTINNPMTPLVADSFWSKTMKPFISDKPPEQAKALVEAVDGLFSDWKRLFRNSSELHISRKPYLLDSRPLMLGAGIIQIKDYADESRDNTLLADWANIQELLSATKAWFFETVTAKNGLNYFGSPKKKAAAVSSKNDRSSGVA